MENQTNLRLIVIKTASKDIGFQGIAKFYDWKSMYERIPENSPVRQNKFRHYVYKDGGENLDTSMKYSSVDVAFSATITQFVEKPEVGIWFAHTHENETPNQLAFIADGVELFCFDKLDDSLISNCTYNIWMEKIDDAANSVLELYYKLIQADKSTIRINSNFYELDDRMKKQTKAVLQVMVHHKCEFEQKCNKCY